MVGTVHPQFHQTLKTPAVIRMATLTQTLSDYLRSKNPKLYMKSCPRGSNTTSKRPPYLIPGSIEKWEDFGYDSLQKIYGGALHRILTSKFSCKDYSDIPKKPYREIANENCLEMLLAVWNWRVISEGLSKAQQCLYGRQDTNIIYMAKGGRSRFAVASKYYPDWAGIQADPEDEWGQEETSKPHNILPGESKLGRKWSSNNIIDGLVHPDYQDDDWMKPLKQIYTYCVKANARYGYIITDEEVVVIRIRPILEPGDSGETNDRKKSRRKPKSSKRGQETGVSQASFPDPDEGHDFVLSPPIFRKVEANGRLEYKVIPWSNAASLDPRRSDNLTVNLALWWLHIMASVSSNIKEQYAPLKEVAEPSCFRVAHSTRKRRSSAISDKSTTSNDSENDYQQKYRTTTRSMKRLRTNDGGRQPVWQMRQ